ncbi:maltase 2-like [Dendroctonus ponderosae]|uniref:alpha-glucosidase n=1 Tax=Dendroctonus ponderosae TaxID=77166 RepID=A0AAR5QDN5_DENPD|nr:maltase 2-like [Dendroctonus ponderosae]
MKGVEVLFVALLCLLYGAKATREVSYTKTWKTAQTNSKLGLTSDDWWTQGVFYQIYPRSFKDSDNDGNGDLQGIIEKLDYLRESGIDAIWLSPIFKSPQVDNGYDISDYREVDELYGSREDLRQLVEAAHQRDLKVILDFVPNHTSDKHIWFEASVYGISPYHDYYVWANATYIEGVRTPPTNWLSNFRGSAWQWNELRQQYYLHQFSTAQPDLNYRNPLVVQEMKDVLSYWLNFGIDGFRIDAVPFLFEDELLRNEPPSGDSGLDPEDASTLSHLYTQNLNETYEMIYEWRQLLDDFTARNGTYSRIMMTEVYASPEQTRGYCGVEGSRAGAHFTFNFITFIENTQKGFDGKDLAESIAAWLIGIPSCSSNWVLGNHDQTRVATRLGPENVDALNILASILPGARITYQGEEIGQENGEVTCEQGYDPQAIKDCSTYQQTSRDFERTPFQWSSGVQAGFNEGHTPWLPVSEKYVQTNLERQSDAKEIKTHYKIYTTMLRLKTLFADGAEESTTWGSTNDGKVFYLKRSTDVVNYGLLINLADTDETIITPAVFKESDLVVELSGADSPYDNGDVFDISQPLRPNEVVVFRITPLA